MATVLIFVEQQPDGRIRKASLHAIEAGKQLAGKLGADLHLALIGQSVQTVASEVASLGAKQIHLIEHASYAHYVAESFTPALTELVQKMGATHLGSASTALGKDLMPRVAARLKAAMASDVMRWGGSGADLQYIRPMWAGNVIAEVKLSTPIQVFTIRATEFPAPTAGGTAATVQAFTPSNVGVPVPTKFVEFKEVKSARPELIEARVVVSGGRGTKGDFKEVEALADELGAAVGASRAVCDAGWVPNDLQVGQTGKVVAPQLYIAAGISGAIEHIAGMKGSKTIVAINKDPEAPIFQVADYGIVADLFKVLPELRAAIHSSK